VCSVTSYVMDKGSSPGKARFLIFAIITLRSLRFTQHKGVAKIANYRYLQITAGKLARYIILFTAKIMILCSSGASKIIKYFSVILYVIRLIFKLIFLLPCLL
jgi:hypothetical protein